MRPVLLFAMTAVFAVAGCGQKAELYLRDNPPPGVKPSKPQPYRPVPYPKEPAAGESAGESK